ncbi:COMM domain-containing protein 9 isoform X1 [Cajanus cajan]|uniref:COMM domain-containing protein 9 isoform X1 n=1 Tax=Cajanus cajan TaxID=3821 RepID=UPI00098D7868|nr:COMM domain-containing protein 9 isoform X1 [Cajanus cajan]
MEQTVWCHLPVLLRANSKESIECILQTLWRTRKTGLTTSDRCIIHEMLHLQNESDLDPLLVCLRMLIRRCVYENTSKEDIPKLFPTEVLPELQKLLTLLLHKFQPEWQQDVLKDQNIVPRLKAMTWNMANVDKESADPAAVINLKLQNDAQFHSGEQDVKFQLATDSLDNMLKAMHCIRDQFSTMDEALNGH